MAKPNTNSTEAMVAMLTGLASLPALLDLVKDLERQIACLRAELRAAQAAQGADGDGWLDAKAAARHIGICPATFDKYRYQTSPKIMGYPIDGKILYKKTELDAFIRTYDVKSRGRRRTGDRGDH